MIGHPNALPAIERGEQDILIMAVDIKNALAEGASSFLGTMKSFAVPLAIGAFVVAIIVGFAPATKKFLQ